MDELLRRSWLEQVPAPPDARRVFYTPTPEGAASLMERGLVIPTPKAGKPVAFACLDWTERRWHLGGVLGRAIVNALVDAGCIEQASGSRVVTRKGALDRWLDW